MNNYFKKGYECLKLLSPFLIIYLLLIAMILSNDTARQNTKTTGKKSIIVSQANLPTTILDFK